ncbi:protein gar2-like isoform X1 [Camellia sinensis]|uniref:protein gar2-like isoform X1 n=2 Tax=Camellia sinensis TaxID=4442 RepID=UPI0010358FE0|nr:protein gar2-like isoform X1 [Camellia sinensis]
MPLKAAAAAWRRRSPRATARKSTRPVSSSISTSDASSSTPPVPSPKIETTSESNANEVSPTKPLETASFISPETPKEAEKIAETNPKNSEEMGRDENPYEKVYETAVIGDGVTMATKKKGAKTVVKKTVRVVKKVVKKRVPKKVQASSSNEESVKSEVDNDGQNPNSSVLGAIGVEKPKPLMSDSMEAENLKPDPNDSVSLEVEIRNSDVAVSMEAENPNSDPANSISMAVEDSIYNVTGSMEVDKPEEAEAEAAEAKDNDSLNHQNLSEAPVSDLIEDKKNGNEGELVVSTTEVQLGDQKVGLVPNQGDEIEIENVDSEGDEGKKGAKQEVENCDVSGLKGEFGMGDGLVLSAEMEALERRKRRKTEIFIGGLDKDAKEEDVRKVFQQAGEIVEVSLVMNDKTGKNKGFAFVQYASAADAMKALAKFSKVEICGKQCSATPVEGNDTIFLGNINKKWKSEDIVKLLQEFGIEKIDQVTVMADPSNIECNRGFAFLELETRRDAKNAYRKLQKNVFGKLQKIKVAWAEPLSEPDEEEMLKVKSVYAEYLPSSWDEEKVRDYFKKFGEIENVTLSRNLHSSRRKDFAFVNYTTREAALACIEAFNRESLNVEGSKVNVKVSLAKPLPKGKQVRHVLNPVSKEPPKEKPMAARSVIMPHQPRTKGKSASRNHEDIQVNRRSSSTTDELVQLLRQQASQRQPQTGLGIASFDQGYPYSLPARKRPVSLLGDDPLYSDPRGYPRARFESSFTAASPGVLSQRVGATSLPYYRQQGSGHASGSLHGVEDYPNSFQTRGAPYHGNSGKYDRY